MVMVGIVVASHSRSLAEGVVEVAQMMAPDVPIIAAVESKLGKTLAEIETSAIRSRTIRKLA